MSLLDYHRRTQVEPETGPTPSFHRPSGSLMRPPSPFAPASFPVNTENPAPASRERLLPAIRVNTGQLQLFDPETGMPVTTGALPRTTGSLRQTVTITRGLTVRKRGQEPLAKVSRWKLRLFAHLITFAGLTLMLLSAVCFVLPTDSHGSSVLSGGIPASGLSVSNIDGNSHGDGQLGFQSSTPKFLNWSEVGVLTGASSIPIDGAGMDVNRFPWGQCTRYANDTYHERTGHWVPWNGNAEMWNDQAALYGWIVSSTPHFPSIIVMERYTQSTGGVGHVAIAESQNADGSVLTSNWNWGGIGAIKTMENFMPGPGISFVYFPGF